MQPQGTSADKYTLLENQSSTIPDTTTNGKRAKNRFNGCSGCIPNAVNAAQSILSYRSHPTHTETSGNENDRIPFFHFAICY